MKNIFNKTVVLALFMTVSGSIMAAETLKNVKGAIRNAADQVAVKTADGAARLNAMTVETFKNAGDVLRNTGNKVVEGASNGAARLNTMTVETFRNAGGVLRNAGDIVVEGAFNGATRVKSLANRAADSCNNHKLGLALAASLAVVATTCENKLGLATSLVAASSNAYDLMEQGPIDYENPATQRYIASSAVNSALLGTMAHIAGQIVMSPLKHLGKLAAGVTLAYVSNEDAVKAAFYGGLLTGSAYLAENIEVDKLGYAACGSLAVLGASYLVKQSQKQPVEAVPANPAAQ